MIGGSGEKKTLRLVAQYADACNIFGGARRGRPQARGAAPPLRRVGRDPNEIEVTAMFRDFPADATPDDLVRAAEEFAAIGVSTLVTGSVGDDPGAWLETTFAPIIDRLHAIEPVRR